MTPGRPIDGISHRPQRRPDVPENTDKRLPPVVSFTWGTIFVPLRCSSPGQGLTCGARILLRIDDMDQGSEQTLNMSGIFLTRCTTWRSPGTKAPATARNSKGNIRRPTAFEV